MHIDNKTQVEVLTGIKVIAVVEKNAVDLNICKSCLIDLFTPKEG